MSNLVHLFSRKLIPADKASARIFDQSLPGKTAERTGRSELLRKGRIGGALTRWWPKHLRTYGDLFVHYRTKEEIYQAEKTALLKSKGRGPPKKGAGKKALKRLADQKKKEQQKAKK